MTIVCERCGEEHPNHKDNCNPKNNLCWIKKKVNKKYQLKPEDWDNQYACMDEGERLGLTRRMGYHAWIAGQGANGYDSVLSFFDDCLDLIKEKDD